MAEIYVPIDSSVAKDAIPPGEDIIYSSKCKFSMTKGGSKMKGGVAYSNDMRVHMHTHLLLTKKGMALEAGGDKSPEGVYIFWHEIEMVTRMPSMIHITKGNRLIRLERDENYESKDKYKKRNKEFFNKCITLLAEAKKERLKEMEANPEKLKKKKIKKMEKDAVKFSKAAKKYGK